MKSKITAVHSGPKIKHTWQGKTAHLLRYNHRCGKMVARRCILGEIVYNAGEVGIAVIWNERHQKVQKSSNSAENNNNSDIGSLEKVVSPISISSTASLWSHGHVESDSDEELVPPRRFILPPPVHGPILPKLVCETQSLQGLDETALRKIRSVVQQSNEFIQTANQDRNQLTLLPELFTAISASSSASAIMDTNLS